MQATEVAIEGMIKAVIWLCTVPLPEECEPFTPMWVALATVALLYTSSLAAVVLLLAVLTLTANQMLLHKLRDPLPTQAMRDTEPVAGSAADACRPAPPLPLPVKAVASAFEESERLSTRLYLPSPRGPAEVLLGLHRAAGTADAALEAAKAAVRGARQAADLAQAARVPRRLPPRSYASSIGTPSMPSTPSTPRTPRVRRMAVVHSASPLSGEHMHGRLGLQPRMPIDVLLPSPRGPLQVLMERSGRTV